MSKDSRSGANLQKKIIIQQYTTWQWDVDNLVDLGRPKAEEIGRNKMKETFSKGHINTCHLCNMK